ncbi:serine dehydratase [Marinitoga sp. 1135]|uniref:L-serine dehydratase n=1 Tax=Marinitoga piezophila (strain DSM 14283 / JCM 11233 / KA3) TaxID=443254 RepID=H2J847_MARPK|nr:MULTISPECIES: L-serine ammonia-lyase, iron-sulfur-dependent subunit beta [Marinitoga]AEX85538.1 L-serine dehydratase, iron-sulfur-dependent, beta subunit [Marinitoga piezophila KA3]APT76011.1 serine dehydratase [Marinitoga sp. 1137]NUU95754.1 serine dehydratase [Marinitoga sp. 1135]NUU97676.1 serine dehydratase [Marinitoga sp. 1138]
MGMLDVVGPVMVGPSSSHTLGALKIARFAHKLFGEKPDKVIFYLHGSFAQTYLGHGTDRALIAGILGLREYDYRIKDAYNLAKKENLNYSFVKTDLGDVHPNTVLIRMEKEGKVNEVQGASIGGGAILITKINGVECELTGDYNTLIIVNKDKKGALENILGVLEVNIANLYLKRTNIIEGKALTILELDEIPSNLEKLNNLDCVLRYFYIGSDKE